MVILSAARGSVATERKRRTLRLFVQVTLIAMPVMISMLRGVNVGGHNRIQMDALRAVYESLGFRDVRTYVQSGNVIFRIEDRGGVPPLRGGAPPLAGFAKGGNFSVCHCPRASKTPSYGTSKLVP